MAEGGTVAIERMFEGVDARNKVAIDIGSGIGGVPQYLAATYNMQITGVEINAWMVKEATRRIPTHLNSLLKYTLLQDDTILPFESNSIDIVFSKGVLVHVEDKAPLFREVLRILKPGGLFLIDDWLSPQKSEWGGNIKKLIELEKLELFATTEVDYRDVLTQTGFHNISMKNISIEYAQYNRDIVARLEKLPAAEKTALHDQFGPTFIADAASGYRFIAQAQEAGELLVYNIKAYKR